MPCVRQMPRAWFEVVLTTVYYSHFFVAPVAAAILWVRFRPAWVRFMRRYLALNILALVIYILYPMSPPWLASRNGYLTPDIARITGRGWYDLGPGNFQDEFSAVGNPVAAMPSLHAGIALFVVLYATVPDDRRVALAAAGLSGGHGVRARLLRRALRRRPAGRLGGRRRGDGGLRVVGAQTRPPTTHGA